MSEIIQKSVSTYTADIYIAGCINRIRELCGEYCERGFCVSITPTEYVFTYGREVGVVIGIINYPRFPRTPDEIKKIALEIGEMLVVKAHQGTCSVVCSDETIMISRRGE